MRAYVVFESMFGNTRDIAMAIGEGLERHGTVEVVEVGTAREQISPDVDLLVVGGPTHAFGLSRPGTRQDAARQKGSAVVSAGVGLREWLTTTGPAGPDVAAAAFDTKINKPIPGSAAHKAEKLLRQHGYRIAATAETFRVLDTPGPLQSGELDRACLWGERLGAMATASHV